MIAKLISIILFCYVFVSCTSKDNSSYKNKVSTTKSTKITNHDIVKINFLEEFYKRYILLVANNIEIEPLKKLIEVSCDENLIIKIDNSDIDYDPFLNAQDANEESINSLEIKKCSNESDIFCVSYLWDSSSEKTNIKLRVSIINGKPKIVDIIDL